MTPAKSKTTASETTRPDTKRMSGPTRKVQVLDTAIALFGRHGLKGTTTKALAQAAGISEATIFKHFPTKKDLYTAAFERRTGVGTEKLVAELQHYADRGEDERLLRTLIRAIFDGYERDRDLHRMLLYAWLEQDTSENEQLWTQVQNDPLFVFLTAYVAQRQDAGAFAPETPAILSAALIALPVHLAINRKLYGVATEYSDDMVVAACTRLLLDGVRVRPPAR